MNTSIHTSEPMMNKEIDDIIECSICYCSMNDDNQLLTECNHRFCILCFKQYIISKKTQQISCPMCRQKLNSVTILNEQEIKEIKDLLHQRRLILVESFPRNSILFYLTEIIDNMNNMNEIVREEENDEHEDINILLFIGCLQLIAQFILFMCLVLKIFIIVYFHIHQIICEILCGWYELIANILQWLNLQKQNRQNRRIDLN